MDHAREPELAGRSVPDVVGPQTPVRLHEGAGAATVRFFSRHPQLADRAENTVERLFKRRHQLVRWMLLVLLGKAHPIFLEYPVTERPRFGYDRDPHADLFEIIDAGRTRYAELLGSFLAFHEPLARIPSGSDEARQDEPTWVNERFGGLDGVALYGLLARGDPARFVEVGSGMSTKFARRAIGDHGLRTEITSIDPQPREEIDRLCDRVVRCGLEDAGLHLFDDLEPGDVLFVDGSHRTFMNSDVTVFFLEVLPRLRPGVLVHLHDIFLPNDYPNGFKGRYFSEQYLLAMYLLGGARGADIVLPCTFVWSDPELSAILSPLWNDHRMATTTTHGSSFWMRTADAP